MNPEGEPDTLMEQDLPVLLFQTLEKPGFLLLLIVFASQTVNLGHHPHVVCKLSRTVISRRSRGEGGTLDCRPIC